MFIPYIVAAHALSAIFWAGSTFVLSLNWSTAPAGMFGPQVGSAAIAFLTGAALWSLRHADVLGTGEIILGIGIIAAAAALLLQIFWRDHPTYANRIASGLLAITVVTMVTWKYV
jgi:hypothetical protein